MTNFKLWLSILDTSDFKNMDPLTIYEKKRICASHFDDHDNSPGTKKLKYNAFPHLNGKQTKLQPKLLNLPFWILKNCTHG